MANESEADTARSHLRSASTAALWILLCSWLVITGWVLSIFKQLHSLGYAASLLVFAGIVAILLSKRQLTFRMAYAPRLRRRFSRPLPLIYLLLSVGAIAGGLLYPPTNYDGITYRVPRILHWLAEGHWHWIATVNDRMNYSATGFEWMLAPLLTLFKSDRAFFVVNAISYYLMPGLVYSVLTGLRIPRPVSWAWMWILPTSYCFVLQAGSIGNDSFAAVYFLAALAFATKARRSGAVFHLCICILAAALLTGSKASNIPLLLPIAFVAAPALVRVARSSLSRGDKPKWSFKRIATCIAAVGVSLLVSFVPISVANHHFTGHWSGDPANSGRMRLNDPFAGIAGNTLQLAVGTVAPPIFPAVAHWNSVQKEFLQSSSMSPLVDAFPRLSLVAGEIPSEEGAGVGIGVGILFLVACLFGTSVRPAVIPMGMAVGLLSWLALLAYMSSLGSECTARLLAAYYPGLLLPALAWRSGSDLVRRSWWKWTAACLASTALIPLALSPARALVPAAAIIQIVEGLQVPGLQVPTPVLERLRQVYEVYSNRNDNLAVLRSYLPANAKVIGFAGTGDESEVSLWRPFGTRIVRDIGTALPEKSHFPAVDCIVASDWGTSDRYGLTPEDFARAVGGRIVLTQEIRTRAGAQPRRWVVILPAAEGRED